MKKGYVIEVRILKKVRYKGDSFIQDANRLALAELKEKGVRLIDEKPRLGAGGAKIAFVHPKASHGVLLELCQRD